MRIYGGRAAAVLAVCLGLGLALGAAGCGRRGALEPAPDANAAPAQETAGAASDPAALQLPRRKKAPRIMPPKVATPLDWLL